VGLLFKILHITLICPTHGIFSKNILDALHKSSGCPGCNRNLSYKNRVEDLVIKFNIIHNNKYNYSKINYINNKTKINIICPTHGDFFQTPNDHLYHGCSKCYGNNKKTFEKFEKIANNIHDYKFTYFKKHYKNYSTKTNIKCNQCSLIFPQKPNNHINLLQGCPSCNKKSKGELIIQEFLIKNNIKYIKNKTFENCKSLKNHKLQFDFFIPIRNLVIEFDGIQHYKSQKIFGGEEQLINQKINDNIKNEFCYNNNINLLRIKYNEIKNIKNILNNTILYEI
jgi:very-short-patch-repair endonuclease